MHGSFFPCFLLCFLMFFCIFPWLFAREGFPNIPSTYPLRISSDLTSVRGQNREKHPKTIGQQHKWQSLFFFNQHNVSKQPGLPRAYGGPGRFTKVREACRVNFQLFPCNINLLVKSCDQKPNKLTSTRLTSTNIGVQWRKPKEAKETHGKRMEKNEFVGVLLSQKDLPKYLPRIRKINRLSILFFVPEAETGFRLWTKCRNMIKTTGFLFLFPRFSQPLHIFQAVSMWF